MLIKNIQQYENNNTIKLTISTIRTIRKNRPKPEPYALYTHTNHFPLGTDRGNGTASNGRTAQCARVERTDG